MKIENTAMASGQANIIVKDEHGKIVHETGYIKNLILQGGLSTRVEDVAFSSTRLIQSLNITPNKETLAGTASQTGNTVTLITPSTSISVGDNILFASGARALVTSINSNSVFTVFENQEITNEIVTLYHSGRGSIESGEVVINLFRADRNSDTFNTNGLRVQTYSGTSGELTSPATVQAIQFDSFSRVFLDTPLQLLAGNTVTVNYDVRLQFNNPVESLLAESPISGMPLEWACDSITSNGSEVIVNTNLEHYYIVGDEVKIENALPTSQATSISSDGILWTLTSVDHGYSVGDNITIEGTSNYDGDYTVNTVVDTDTFTIVNTANDSTQGGMVRFTEPVNYFNTSYIVASVSGSNQLTLTSSLDVDTPPSNNGSLSSLNSACKLNYWGNWDDGLFPSGTDNTTILRVSDSELIANPLSYGEFSTLSSVFTDSISRSTSSEVSSPSLSNGYTESYNYNSATSEDNHHERIKQILFESDRDAVWMLTFDHIQSKPNTFDLDVTTSVRYLQDLT